MEAIKIELLNELVEMCKKSQDLMGTGIVLIPTPTGFESFDDTIEEFTMVCKKLELRWIIPSDPEPSHHPEDSLDCFMAIRKKH